MEDKQLPVAIPFTRIIAPILFIVPLAGFLAWRLTNDVAIVSEDTTYSRLMQQIEIKCVWPRFSVFDHSLLRRTNYVRTVECQTTQPSFASLDNDGILTISAPYSTHRNYSNVRCTYSTLASNGSGGVVLDRTIPILRNGRRKVVDDQFVVQCFTPDDYIVYEEAFFNPKAKFSVDEVQDDAKPLYAPSDPSNPSLAILLLDDVSQAHFARHLPKTMKMMMDQDFFMPSRYSQISNSSSENLDYILNGENGTSLVELMKERGCLTFLNVEIVEGMDNSIGQKTHFSSDLFHRFNVERQQDEFCLANGESKASSILTTMIDFSSSFRSSCHLSITHLHSPSDRSLIGSIDDDLTTALSNFITTSSNTVLFILSPAGLLGTGLAGRVEGKSPLLSAWFPMSFRKERNAHYSAFAWNMDKLFSTRDVRMTLEVLSSGSLPKSVLVLDPDMEQNEVTSLLSEQLPEERNCSSINIPEENCLCLGTDEIRNATINTDEFLYDRVFELVASRAIQLPCVDDIEIDERYFHINSYQLIGREFEDEAKDIEWLTLKFNVNILNYKLLHANKAVRFQTTVRHYLSSGRLEYIEAIIIASPECHAIHLERLCSLCYNLPFRMASAPGPNKGFLLDMKSAVV